MVTSFPLFVPVCGEDVPDTSSGSATQAAAAAEARVAAPSSKLIVSFHNIEFMALLTLCHNVISWEVFICSSKSVWWFPPKSIKLSRRDVCNKENVYDKGGVEKQLNFALSIYFYYADGLFLFSMCCIL